VPTQYINTRNWIPERAYARELGDLTDKLQQSLETRFELPD